MNACDGIFKENAPHVCDILSPMLFIRHVHTICESKSGELLGRFYIECGLLTLQTVLDLDKEYDSIQVDENEILTQRQCLKG